MKQVLDWSHLYPNYANQWVAFAKDRETVVGNGRSLRAAVKKAERRGVRDPMLFKVPAQMLPYVGGC